MNIEDSTQRPIGTDLWVAVYRAFPSKAESNRKWRKYTEDIFWKLHALSRYDVRQFFGYSAHSYRLVLPTNKMNDLVGVLETTQPKKHHWQIEEVSIAKTWISSR
jgi:hypothetical protein